MSAEVAEAIRQTRRTLAEKTWVARAPRVGQNETCLGVAVGLTGSDEVGDAFRDTLGIDMLVQWNDWQTDVGAVLGMTLQALIAELCKPTALWRGK